VTFDELRWTRLKDMEPRLMFDRMADHVFPFLRTLGGDGSAYARRVPRRAVTAAIESGPQTWANFQSVPVGVSSVVS
jgi:hypothetical protein